MYWVSCPIGSPNVPWNFTVKRREKEISWGLLGDFKKPGLEAAYTISTYIVVARMQSYDFCPISRESGNIFVPRKEINLII